MNIWRIADAVVIVVSGCFIIWLLTTIINGSNAIHEPNKALLWSEIILTSGIALYGVVRYIQAFWNEWK